jgi:hypothetical protein
LPYPPPFSSYPPHSYFLAQLSFVTLPTAKTFRFLSLFACLLIKTRR